MKLKQIVLLLLLCVAVGCAPEGEKGRAEFAYPERVTSREQVQWINIYSSAPWKIEVRYKSDDSGWCSLSQTAGGGTDSEYTPVSVNVARNESGKERSVEFHVRFPENTTTLTLTQLPSGAVLPYLELPAYAENNSQIVATHYYTDNHGGTVRNFSVLYDTTHRLPLWVAYTLHTSSVVGNVGRTDDWRYDPQVPASGQPDLSRSYRGWYDRGHMLPSGSRQANAMANSQTFYFTNIAPQLNAFNTGKWVDLENRLRTWKGSGQDTLYVVTGAVLRTVGGSEPISKVGSYANSEKQTSIPNYFYKACLKMTMSGGVPHYKAIAIFLPHTDNPTSERLTDDEIMSIDELEAKIGVDFFTNLPDEVEGAVEAECSPGLWGL